MPRIIREWYLGLTPLQRLGLCALVTTGAAVVVIVAAPKTCAAAVGGALAAVGAKALAFAFATAASG
jgi:hypothetical protein